MTGPFVGRTEETALLERALDELELGHPKLVELAGEPGIGKTRLLKEVAVRAEARGRLVLSGSASELEHDVPFAVFVDAVDEYLAGLEPGRLDGLDVEVQAELDGARFQAVPGGGVGLAKLLPLRGRHRVEAQGRPQVPRRGEERSRDDRPAYPQVMTHSVGSGIRSGPRRGRTLRSTDEKKTKLDPVSNLVKPQALERPAGGRDDRRRALSKPPKGA